MAGTSQLGGKKLFIDAPDQPGASLARALVQPESLNRLGTSLEQVQIWDQSDVDEDHEMGEAFMDMFAIVTDLSVSAEETEMPASASEVKATMLVGISWHCI